MLKDTQCPEKKALCAKIWSCWDFDSRLIVVTWVCFLISVNVTNKSSRTTKCDLLCPITSSNRRVLKTIFELRRERVLCPYRILISCVVSSISFPYLYLCAFVTVQAHWKIRFHNILSMNSTWLLFFELHLSNNGKFFLHSYRNSVTVAQKFLSEILLTLSDIFV